MLPRWLPRPALVLLAVLAAIAAALAGVELVLRDGKTFRGESVQREGDVYSVTTESGELMTLPADLVREVRVVGEEKPAEDEAEEPPEAPTGLTAGPPRQLAGPKTPPPRRDDQLGALGKPAEFQKPIIDPTWRPTSALSDEDVLAANRVEWQQPVIDPTWKPTSAYDAKVDVLAANRVEWQKPSIDPTWTPTDGFGRSAF